MTKQDGIPDFSYAWRIDMVPDTVCDFSTDGSAYGTWESEISVYYTKENCLVPDVSTYATSGDTWHGENGLVPDEAVCDMHFRIRNDAAEDMQTIYFYTTGALEGFGSSLAAAGSIAAYMLI